MLRSFPLVAVVLLCLVRGAFAGEPLEGWDSTNTFTVTVTDADLRNTPSWTGSGNPPLSARKATRLLTPVEESLVHKEKDFKPWRLSTLSLKQGEQTPDQWYWVATYEAWYDGRAPGGTGGPYTLYLVVLMDGRVIKPVVRKGHIPEG
jgi:hypothetical protein